MEFRPYTKIPLEININYKNINLETVTKFNLLGIYLDSNLNWKTHIEHIKLKLNKFTYALFQLKYTTDTKTALSAYYAYAYSWLRYGVMLWGNSVKSNEIFILQKKCIRILAQIDNTESCRPYFKKFNILTLPSLYLEDICTFVFKHKHIFPRVEQTHNINTRHKKRLYLPLHRLKMLSNSPYHMSIKIYSKLPLHIQEITHEKLFKNELKSYLVQGCFYSIDEFMNV